MAENETTVAEVFKVLGRTDTVNEALKLAKKDQKDTEARLEVRRDDLLTATDALKELDNTQDLRQRMDALTRATAHHLEETKNRAADILNIRLIKTMEATPLPKPPPELNPYTMMWLELTNELIELGERTLPTPPTKIIPPDTTLLELAQELLALETDLTLTQEQGIFLQRSIEETEAERKKLEHEAGTCPTCNRPFEGR